VEECAIESWDRQHLLSAFPGPPTRVDSDFMSIDPTVTFFILACSWRQVQRCPVFRSEIAYAVVEEGDIEFWDRQHYPFCLPKTPGRVNSNFMSIDAIETYPIPACSWR